MKEVILTMVLPNTEWQNALIATDGIAIMTRLPIARIADKSLIGRKVNKVRQGLDKN